MARFCASPHLHLLSGRKHDWRLHGGIRELPLDHPGDAALFTPRPAIRQGACMNHERSTMRWEPLPGYLALLALVPNVCYMRK
jgi:hypothetical protein